MSSVGATKGLVALEGSFYYGDEGLFNLGSSELRMSQMYLKVEAPEVGGTVPASECSRSGTGVSDRLIVEEIGI